MGDLNVLGPEARGDPFKRGDAVEVAMKEPDLKGSWYEAHVTAIGENGLICVKYDQLVDDDSDPSSYLVEIVEASMVRPRPPPRRAVEEFRKGDLVEVSINDGWWIGAVSEVVSSSSYFLVVFPDGDLREVDKSELRTRLDWVDNKWVPAKMLVESELKTVKMKRKQRRLTGSARKGPLVKPVVKKVKSSGSPGDVTKKCINFDKVVEETSGKESSQACTSQLSNESACPFSELVDFSLKGHATPDSVPVCGSSSKLALAETSPQPLQVYCFRKTSPIWDTFPTMKQLQGIPQYPHFRPLEQASEEIREKMAISMMIDYVDLVDSVYNPQSAISLCGMDKNEVLLKILEQNGFDLKEVRLRMQALIEVKEREEKNNCERVSLEMKLFEVDKAKSQVELELDAIDKQMKELEQRRALTSKSREEYESEGIMLQERLKMLQDRAPGMLATS